MIFTNNYNNPYIILIKVLLKNIFKIHKIMDCFIDIGYENKYSQIFDDSLCILSKDTMLTQLAPRPNGLIKAYV